MVEFESGSVPVAVAARVYGKDACWVIFHLRNYMKIQAIFGKEKENEYYS